MTFRIRQIDYTADHRRIVRDRIADAPMLSIGRNAASDIALPDLAVELDHARLSLLGPDRVAVRTTGTLGFEVDGRPARDVTIDATAGAELRFGSHRIAVHREEDGAILLEIENMAAGGLLTDPADDKAGFSLHRAVRGKRLVAWGAVLAILILFLVWPIASHLTHQRAAAAGVPASAGAVTGDAAWNPGPLSLAHANLTDKCEACHVKSFQSVRNETCQGCHKDTADHADPARLAAAHGRTGLGRAALDRIGAAFGRDQANACVDCHVEHQGRSAMAPPAQKFCADCHAALKEKLPDTKLGNAADFGTAHPQFAASIVGDAERRRIVRVSLDARPQEQDGLIFSHKLHLDRAGGVARMAASLGSGKALDCAACHAPAADGVGFQPVSMERNCESCHSLAYARSGGTVLKLRHGDLDQAIADLRRAGTQPAIGMARGRPGQFGAAGLYHADFGGGRTLDPLAPDGLCGGCHVRVVRNGKPAIGRVILVDRYLPHGWFDHAAHRQEACASCHAAPASGRSGDVLIPGIATCRGCHLGEAAAPPKVASGCAMCHAYHGDDGAPSGSRRRTPARAAAPLALLSPPRPPGSKAGA